MKANTLPLKNLLFFFLFVFSQTVFAQKMQKGFKQLENKKYEKAIKIFRKSGKDKSEIIAAKYGLALVYSDTTFNGFSALKAYNLAKSALAKYAKLKDKTILEEVYQISENSISDLKNKIAEQEYTKINDYKSLKELSIFIRRFEDTDKGKSVAKQRNHIAYKTAQKENTYQAYQKFVNSFPKAEEYTQAYQKYKTLWQKEYFEAAQEGEIATLQLFESENPDYPFYNKVTKKNKKLANFVMRLALAKGFQKEYVKDYQKYIKEAAPKELAFVVVKILMQPDLSAGNWKNAADTLRKYQQKFPENKRFDKLIGVLEQADEKIQKTSISESINTETGSEYAASITADGKNLYFCGRNREDNLGKDEEDIFVSHFENGDWSAPRLLENINSADKHEAPLSIRADGNRMLMFSESDIFYTDRTSEGWTLKQRLPAVNENTSWEADAIYTADGKAVFFISDRRGNIGRYHLFGYKFHGGGNGNSDIYVTTRTSTGWTKPQNLGATINTPWAERSPFLHSDMKTLYFSSEGHGSLGGLDVFKCIRLNDTSWTQWSEPINLGKNINTFRDDYDYEIATDGKKAYFSSFDGYTNDIMLVNLPEKMQPEIVVAVRGKVTDNKNENLFATIKWEDLETGKLVGLLENDPTTGNYYIVIPYGKNYGYYVDKKGYYPISGNIDLRNKKVQKDIYEDMKLTKISEIIEGKKAITLTNIFFETSKYDLQQESKPELERLSGFLKANPTLKVEISGHTDNQGNAKENLKLSDQRAKAVATYLQKLGCNPANIAYKGYGDQNPTTTNSTQIGRAKNRRVEFKIIN